MQGASKDRLQAVRLRTGWDPSHYWLDPTTLLAACARLPGAGSGGDASNCGGPTHVPAGSEEGVKETPSRAGDRTRF
jgi:hypothetical protein